MSIDTKESLRIFLAQQLKDVEGDIETISGYISNNPPETSGELPLGIHTGAVGHL